MSANEYQYLSQQFSSLEDCKLWCVIITSTFGPIFCAAPDRTTPWAFQESLNNIVAIDEHTVEMTTFTGKVTRRAVDDNCTGLGVPYMLNVEKGVIMVQASIVAKEF